MTDNKSKTKDRNLSLEKVRNIGIIAHINAGKTTATERVLYYTGKIHKIGVIDDGTTTTDTMDQEKEKGITIQSACITTFWQDCRFNIIDTPGHVDFTAEVERSLRVLDGAIMIFDGNAGVQAQSETVWRQADKYKVPRLIFVNKMDKVGADIDMVLKSIEERLGSPVISMVLPVGKEHDFIGVIDLLNEKVLLWDKDEEGVEFTVKELEPDQKEKAAPARAKMVEKIAAEDDTLMEKFLNDQEITVPELKKALRAAVIKNKLSPVYCGSAWRNKAVQPILDAVVDYLPSPLDLPPTEGFRPGSEERTCGLAFKIQTDPHVGRLSYLRIYSGTLSGGATIYNSSKQKSERIGRLLLMHADKREGIEEAYAGEIVACIGLKDSNTGDTLCDAAHPILLEQISFPDPVISLAIEPATKNDQEKMGNALARLAEEDPTFHVKIDHETGQTVISGMGELYLEIIIDRLKREFSVNVNVGKPQVAYRETITQTSTGEGKYIRQSGGRGQYGHCFLRLEPKGRGEGFEFSSEIKGAAIPNNFIPSIQKGVIEAMGKGVVAGYPLVDMKVAVYDGSYHEVDSSDMAFKIAGSIALQDAVKKANPTVIEPVMRMEVTAPSDHLGTVIGDLSSRRAQILGTEEHGNYSLVNCFVPLAEVRGYATVIRSLTQGRGYFYMELGHYEEVPKNIQESLATIKA